MKKTVNDLLTEIRRIGECHGVAIHLTEDNVIELAESYPELISPQDIRFIVDRYGLGGKRSKSFNEIAIHSGQGITGTRVMQRVRRAVRVLALYAIKLRQAKNGPKKIDPRSSVFKDMSTRLYRCLARGTRISTIEELAPLSESDLLKIRGIGPKLLLEIRTLLAKKGVKLRE